MPTTEFWISEIRNIMAKGTGPFTRKMIAKQLAETHNLSWQELMLNISIAIQADKRRKVSIFKSAGQGWWDLADKNNI